MDVACPRCATEYEFDEARIPSDGVTVKCTQCSHVFRIKKKASAFTTEVSQPGRDWKLRHADGRIESFQKLTTLHQWIVERRVSRNDEVSLSGETWKRLGDIAELASFFMLVDEAERGRTTSRSEVKTQPEAYASAPPPPPLPKQDPMKETLRGGQFPPLPPLPSQAKTLPPDAPEPIELEPVTEPQPRTGTGKHPAFTPQPPPPPSDLTPAPQPLPGEQSIPQALGQPRRIPSRSMKAVSAARSMPDDDDLFRSQQRSGGAGRWIGLFLLVAGLAGAGGYYIVIWQPQQEQLARQREDDAKARADDAKRLADEKAKADALAAQLAALEAAKDAGPAVDAGAVAVAPVVDAGAVAVAPVVDAGAPAVDAGTAVAVADAGVKAPVKRDFDQWMALGDRLRSNDRAEQALNAYGEAADLKPERVEPIAGRGLALLDMGKQLQAEASFEQALKLSPRYGPALMGMAETYRYMNKPEKAIEYYEKYLDVLPDGSEANVAKTQIDRLKKGQ